MKRRKPWKCGKTSGDHSPFTGPDLLTLARFPIAGGIFAIAIAASSPSRWLLVALFVCGIATDAIDGSWARRLGVASERGARLDSAADGALAVAVAVAVGVLIEWSLAPWSWWAIAAVAAIRVAGLCVTLARFQVASIAHTWGNKATGIVVAAAALWALASGRLGGWSVAAACAVAAFAALEELVMAATTRAYYRDMRGWWDKTPPHELSVPPRKSRPQELT